MFLDISKFGGTATPTLATCAAWGQQTRSDIDPIQLSSVGEMGAPRRGQLGLGRERKRRKVVLALGEILVHTLPSLDWFICVGGRCQEAA